ncbi:hypothetical protein HX021_08235 [Sphingobacterium sp. N143]|uniref:hypothetical protein n=1 Tax=Sphingobacterium sp. N143 TaxID=2746727 RepID=UPI00257642B7|nr:hypothetical protein [Sphingobacterium sp. N143]MDM1294285.1 hypothetical protein [Sphingobacterium sp. N143]
MITVHWHLIVVIVITVFLLAGAFKERDGLDITPIFYIFGIVVLWAIYGGIFLW